MMKAPMHSGSKTRICTSFVIAITFCTAFPPLNALYTERYFIREFEWSFKGRVWTMTSEIPKSLYDAYSGVSLSQRTHSVGGYDFLITTQDYKMKSITDSLHEAASKEGYHPYDEVSFILAFVQSLPYTSDSVTTGFDEFPRFPIETLVDGGGDCEDTSILFATIVLILGYDTILITPPDHVAVGVLGDDLPGFYFEYDGRRYYYCETTSENWEIGGLPEHYQDIECYLYPIDESKQFHPILDTPDILNQDAPDALDEEDGNILLPPEDFLLLGILLIVGFVAVLFGGAYLLLRKSIPGKDTIIREIHFHACMPCSAFLQEQDLESTIL